MMKQQRKKLKQLKSNGEVKYPCRVLYSISDPYEAECLLAEQLKMKEKLVEMDRFVWQIDDYLASSSTTTTLSRKKIQRLAGVDISFLKGSNKHACASLVVLELSSFRVLYEALKYFSLPAPYITGFLAFREVPALQELYQDLLDRYPGEAITFIYNSKE
jgi:hypothetical protein